MRPDLDDYAALCLLWTLLSSSNRTEGQACEALGYPQKSSRLRKPFCLPSYLAVGLPPSEGEEKVKDI